MIEKPIAMDTFGALADYGYRINVFCPSCQEHREIDVHKMPRDASIIKRKYKCAKCGTVGQSTLANPHR